MRNPIPVKIHLSALTERLVQVQLEAIPENDILREMRVIFGVAMMRERSVNPKVLLPCSSPTEK